MAFLRYACSVMLLGVTWCGAENRGYLAAVGPGLLRFQAPVLSVVPADWPLLRMHTPQPVDPEAEAASTNQPPAAITNNVAPPLGDPRPTPDTTPSPATVQPLPLPSSAELDPLHPQTWLKYFVPGSTNGNAPSVLLPVDFTPPHPQPPAAAPASRATYTVTPRAP